MQLKKKDKVLLGIAGVLFIIVVIVYALYYGGDAKPDPINPADYTKAVPGKVGGKPSSTPASTPAAPVTPAP